MMSDIYINEATGKKIKVYQVTDVHVWDDEDNWKTSKIIVDTVDELLVLVREATEIERAE